eukprot:TRINITY_DN2918_c0_g1_i1.p1 TRINITY_DN2918_c0_g1~~TRINITY_DN2918_c0_g1_i1.p1  ORF type:complete len:382 (+),score=99.61 TRINITY_DN2918_c0_g1_i1:84-1148(+)
MAEVFIENDNVTVDNRIGAVAEIASAKNQDIWGEIELQTIIEWKSQDFKNTNSWFFISKQADLTAERLMCSKFNSTKGESRVEACFAGLPSVSKSAVLQLKAYLYQQDILKSEAHLMDIPKSAIFLHYNAVGWPHSHPTSQSLEYKFVIGASGNTDDILVTSVNLPATSIHAAQNRTNIRFGDILLVILTNGPTEMISLEKLADQRLQMKFDTDLGAASFYVITEDDTDGGDSEPVTDLPPTVNQTGPKHIVPIVSSVAVVSLFCIAAVGCYCISKKHKPSRLHYNKISGKNSGPPSTTSADSVNSPDGPVRKRGFFRRAPSTIHETDEGAVEITTHGATTETTGLPAADTTIL